jgi:hypothetical protein
MRFPCAIDEHLFRMFFNSSDCEIEPSGQDIQRESAFHQRLENAAEGHEEKAACRDRRVPSPWPAAARGSFGSGPGYTGVDWVWTSVPFT